MNQNHELPNVIEMEKQLLCAMFSHKGKIVPSVLTILAEYYAKTIKEKAKFRKFLEVGQKLVDDAKKATRECW